MLTFLTLVPNLRIAENAGVERGGEAVGRQRSMI